MKASNQNQEAIAMSMPFSCSVEKLYFSDFFITIFSFSLINAFQSYSNINFNSVYVLGYNIMLWDHLRTHFNLCQAAQMKMSLSQAQNIFMPASMTSIVSY